MNPRNIEPTTNDLPNREMNITDTLKQNSAMIGEMCIDVNCIERHLDGKDIMTPDIHEPSCLADELENQSIALTDMRLKLKEIRELLGI